MYTDALSGTPGDLILGTYPNGHTNQLVLQQSTGSVGIGTATPGAGVNTKFDVVGRTSFRPISGNTNKALIFDDLSGALRMYTDALSGTPGDLILGTYPNGHFNQLFLQQSTGNVGIGTQGPNAKLQIAGGAIMPEVGNSTSAGIYFPTNPGGGAGDEAFIRYYVRIGEATTLAIGINSDADDHIALMPSGNVGIGTTSPGNILTVVQNSSTDPIADAWTIYSSRRWKTNVRTLESALEKVQRLRGVSYDWKANGKHDIGLIAEEVGEVVPEVVAYEENGKDAKSVDYARLVALLIEGMKEQRKEIEELKIIVKSLVSDKQKAANTSLGKLR